MGNVRIYSVGRDLVYQIWQNDKTECFAGRPYPRNTRENQLSQFVMTLRIPIMCWAHASLREKSSRELLAKTPLIFDESWIFTLSHTQPIQRNLTYNTGYIRLNRITIKFGTELKPTQISCKSQLYIFIYIWWCMFLHLSLHVLFLFSFYTNVSLCMQSLFSVSHKMPWWVLF